VCRCFALNRACHEAPLLFLQKKRQYSLSLCYHYEKTLLSLSYHRTETTLSRSIITKATMLSLFLLFLHLHITFSLLSKRRDNRLSLYYYERRQYILFLSPSLPISPLFLCTTRCSRAVLRKEPLHQLSTERLHQLSLHQLKHCTNSRKHCTNSREQCTNSHYTNFLARLRSLTHSRASARTRVLANSLARAHMCSAR